jgi:CelD/BcsL family acetyltransferase involved in cellulose biosynthesis
MINVRIIDKADDLDAIASDWQRLWLAQPRREVFTHQAWSKVFLDVYGPGKGLRCLVVEGSGVKAILPLFRDVRGCLRFVGDPRSDYSDMLCLPAEVGEVAPVLLEALSREKVMTLSALPEHSLFFSALKSMKHPFEIAVEEPCPAIEFDLEGAVVKELLKKESLRRHEKKVAKLGPIRLERAGTQSEALSWLPVLFDQHIARWKTTPTPSLFETEDHRRFYEQLVVNETLWPMVDFRLVYAGDRVVATHFGFFHDQRFIWYKPSFDPEISNLGPGEVLLKYLIAAAADEGAREFDFTRGGEGFKQRFATVTRNNYVVSRRSLMQKVRAAAGRVRRMLRKQS